MAASSSASAAQQSLQPNEEFRFEVDGASTVSLTLVSGSAEIFGAEMVESRAYSFCGTQQAVFSWSGCTLEIQGQCGHSYVATETPMASYLQLHGDLDARRNSALASGTEGPRVLIAGPVDTGKSSLSRLLANYLARSGHAGTFIDLDLDQGELLVPGAVCAVPVVRPLDIERDTEDLEPLAFWVGQTSASESVAHVRLACSALAQAVRRRHEVDSASRAGGVIVSTSGWVDGPGYELLLHQASEMQVDVLVVIGDDRLHSQLQAHSQQQPGLQPHVVKLAKSGGVITRSPQSRQEARHSRLREYFYGPRRELYPHATELDFGTCKVYTLGVAPAPPSSAMPIGMKIVDDRMVAQQVSPARYPALLHSLLAVVLAEGGTCDDLLRANAAGFVHVTKVDMERQKLTLLAPSPVTLPQLYLLAGVVKWDGE